MEPTALLAALHAFADFASNSHAIGSVVRLRGRLLTQYPIRAFRTLGDAWQWFMSAFGP